MARPPEYLPTKVYSSEQEMLSEKDPRYAESLMFLVEITIGGSEEKARFYIRAKRHETAKACAFEQIVGGTCTVISQKVEKPRPLVKVKPKPVSKKKS